MNANHAPAPSEPSGEGASPAWVAFHERVLGCDRCVRGGFIPFATPMFQGRPGQRIMLIGQAPGVMEVTARKPFAARAGAELGRWMLRAGFESDDHFRTLTYVTSVTKCFPGKSATGAGDRRPSPVEVALCREWLAGQLALVRPRLILLIGTLAQAQFLPGRTLDSLVARLFDASGIEIDLAAVDPPVEPLLLPLPHPSGASRWLNHPDHRRLLNEALLLLARTWPLLSGPRPPVTTGFDPYTLLLK